MSKFGWILCSTCYSSMKHNWCAIDSDHEFNPCHQNKVHQISRCLYGPEVILDRCDYDRVLELLVKIAEYTLNQSPCFLNRVSFALSHCAVKSGQHFRENTIALIAAINDVQSLMAAVTFPFLAKTNASRKHLPLLNASLMVQRDWRSTWRHWPVQTIKSNHVSR